MTMHLERDLESLRKNLLMLGSLVEETTTKALEYLVTNDANTAAEIDALEQQVNEMEVEIEEDCLKILALHQPVAIDLRFIIVVLKVNNDLERMGDQAVNIASRVQALSPVTELTDQLQFDRMSEATLRMVRQSIDALINHDVKLAHKVVGMDDEVDNLHASNYETLRQYAVGHPDAIASAMSYGTISSNLERIGDLCTNIAEDVIFMIDGHVIRHRPLGSG